MTRSLLIVEQQTPKKWLILGVTPTGGRLSSIIHQMKAKNLRIQKLRDAGTKKLYKQRYRTVSMATFLK